MFDKTKARYEAKVTDPINKLTAIAGCALVLSMLAIMFALATYGKKASHAV
jgi:hypothetical protein